MQTKYYLDKAMFNQIVKNIYQLNPINMKRAILITLSLILSMSAIAQTTFAPEWDGFTRSNAQTNEAYFTQNGRTGGVSAFNTTELRIGVYSFDFSSIVTEIESPELQLFNTASIDGEIYLTAVQHDLTTTPTWDALGLMHESHGGTMTDMGDTVVTKTIAVGDANAIMSFSSAELTTAIVDAKNAGKKLALIVINPGSTIKFAGSDDATNAPVLSYTEGTPIPVTGVTLSKEAGFVNPGETYELTATVAPYEASNKNVTWTSSDEGVATVVDGVVTGVALGTATITVTTADGSFTDTFEVTVDTFVASTWDGFQMPTRTEAENAAYFAQNGRSGPIAVIKNFGRLGFFSFNLSSVLTEMESPQFDVMMDAGTADFTGTTTLYLVAKQHGLADNVAPTYNALELTRETMEDTVATLDIANTAIGQKLSFSSTELTNAIVAAKNDGKKLLLIIGTTDDGPTIKIENSNQTFVPKLTYTEGTPIPVTGVTLDADAGTIDIGATQALTATVAPYEASNKNVTWSSSDDAIATVVDGIVTGVAEGAATITVTTNDGGFTDTFAATIVAAVPVTGVTLDAEAGDIQIGATQTLTATVEPAEATNKTITWSTSDEAIATVADGVVTGIALGTATITVTTENGGFTDTFIATIVPVPVTGVTVDPAAKTIGIGASFTLQATVAPENATNQNVTWSSDAEAVATVVDGLVTGVTAGMAVITVTTEDGSFTATSTITVEEGAGGSLSPQWDGFTRSIESVQDNDAYMAQSGRNDLSIFTRDGEEIRVGVFSFDLSSVSNDIGEASLSLYNVTTSSLGQDAKVYITAVQHDLAPNVAPTWAQLDLTTSMGDTVVIQPITDDDRETRMEFSSSELALKFNEARNAGKKLALVVTIPGGLTLKFENSNNDNKPVLNYSGSPVAVTGVSLNVNDAILKVNETIDLIATVTPEDAVNQNVTWESSNQGVATVDNNGVVTGVFEGMATITVTTDDGGFTDTCLITVAGKVLSVNLDEALFGIYPNPASNIIRFSEPVKTAQLISINGNLIKTVLSSDHVDVSGFKRGTYIIAVELNDGNTYKQKLIIE
jgi:uncharacterized protein YjdB